MHRSLAAVLASVVLCTGLATTSPAHADEVSQAQADVAHLQGLVSKTTESLLRGTREWEADQARLAVVRLKLHNTQRHVVQAQQAIDAQRAQLSAIARRLYMRPTPAILTLALTRGPDEVVDALQAADGLKIATGSEGQVIARARTARLRLQNDEQAVAALQRDAARLAASAAKKMARLQALALDTASQLDQAQTRLQQARAAKAARAALAVRAARARAARVAAQRDRGGASCTSHASGNQQNGNLDPATLCPLWQAPGQRLRYDAAAAFNLLSHYRATTLGAAVCVSDSYRTYGQQVDVYRRKPGLAAVPGTSEHGWGLAVDLCGGVESFGSPAYEWMKVNAGRFGFFHPDWAEPYGSRPEAWHWEFRG